ncbi:unnamed protein product [Mycena citricolor]|uniref:Cytochrome P450 n=1 Tax=Mycena citricolor TaxID=2018698 RepID=A0AAD2JZY9_9AGAR|nr:unnamed protein product [Mycena citricolor]
MISNILLPIVYTLLSYVLVYVVRILYRNWTSPLKFVDGPSCVNPILGHLQLISDNPGITNEWRAQYGPTFMAKGMFFVRSLIPLDTLCCSAHVPQKNELHTKDLKAVAHIVTHGALYQKTHTSLGNQRRILGEGILSVELDPHKRQASHPMSTMSVLPCLLRQHLASDHFINNPAFGIPQIRAMNEIFVEKGNMMRDMLTKRLRDNRGPATIDLSSWFRQVTLDIIGQAGFGYQFNALQTHGKDEAELGTVFRQLFHSPKANLYRSIQLAQVLVPALKLLPLPGSHVTCVAQTRLRAIGKTLFYESKAKSASISDGKGLNRGRDLLSLLIKANMSDEIQASQRLTDDEVISQIATFVSAGHETTSTALSWAAHALSQNPEIQDKLRQELLSLPTDNPSMDKLNSLPFLKNFVRETMRLYAPVVFHLRNIRRGGYPPLLGVKIRLIWVPNRGGTLRTFGHPPHQNLRKWVPSIRNKPCNQLRIHPLLALPVIVVMPSCRPSTDHVM